MTDEETPLLFPTEDTAAHEESDEVTTPLPKLQIGILLFFLLSEPICSQFIYPFITQVTQSSNSTPTHLTRFKLISELGIAGGDEKKLGYYAGKQERAHAIQTPDPESRF